MTLVETDYLPFAAASVPTGPWLVLAPHPDDETFGMGASIYGATQAGYTVDVIVLTDGALGGEGDSIVALREAETRTAGRLLGVSAVDFWREPDRGLVPNPRLIERVADKLVQAGVRAVFFPSIFEPHPDHRAAAIIGWEAARMAGFSALPFGYEISAQGPINRLVDVTDWLERKIEAMDVYASQSSQRPYARRVLAQNVARTWSLPEEVEYAEAFLQLEAADQSLQQAVSPLLRRYLLGIDIPQRQAAEGLLAFEGAKRLSAPLARFARWMGF